jgi:hypothetical protein
MMVQWRSREICTGALSYSRGVLHGSYQSLPWDTSRENNTETILHGKNEVFQGKNEVFQSNRNDFPLVSFTLDGIWRHMRGIILQLEVNKMV